MFGIYLHEYGESAKLLKILPKREAADFIENHTADYIFLYNGSGPEFPKIYDSVKKGPLGYFRTRSTKDSITKLTVWNKIRHKGLIYHSYELNEIYTIDMISIGEDVVHFPKVEDIEAEMVSPETVRIMLDEVLAELRSANDELIKLEDESNRNSV